MSTPITPSKEQNDAEGEEEKRFDLSEGAPPKRKAAPSAQSAPHADAAGGDALPSVPPEAASVMAPALIAVGALAALSLLASIFLASGLHGLGLGAVLLVSSLAAAFFAFRRTAAARATLGNALQAAAEREAQAAKRHDAQTEREAGLRAAVEGVSDAVLIADIKGRITLLNPSAERLTGLTQPEALGREIAPTVRLVNADSGRDIEAPTARTLQQFLTVPTLPRTALRGRDGRSLPVEGVSAPVWDGKGRLLGATLILRGLPDTPPQTLPDSPAPASDAELRAAKADALAARAELRDLKASLDTARVSLETGDRARAEQTRREADRLRQERSRFLAEISNELRTPLNTVLGYTEMLKEQAEDEKLEELLPDLGRIQEGGAHLLNLVNDLVNLSRLEAGQVDLFTESCDIPSLVDEVAQAIAPVLERSANILSVNCPPELGAIQTDRGKLRQSLLYLLSATGRFTSQRALELDAARRAESDGREWVVFQVVDRGSSLPAVSGASGGAASGQSSASAGPSSSASGVGLEISRRFCQMMGGDLSVATEPGRGTVYTLKLPAQPRTDAPHQ